MSTSFDVWAHCLEIDIAHVAVQGSGDPGDPNAVKSAPTVRSTQVLIVVNPHLVPT